MSWTRRTDADSQLPVKRIRTSLNGNLQISECVREFKLPRQFPSLAAKVSSDVLNDKNKLQTNFNQAVTCSNKTPINTKIVTKQEIPATNLVRKIKLKGLDGRDLGEVNVQDLPQNIQGKTITLAKNGSIKSPEIVSIADKSKGVTIGVLTPINIVKTDNPYTTNIPALTCVKDQKQAVDIAKEGKKPVIVEQKQMSAVMDQQGRPQVLVFQSGKNWHMVKIATGPKPGAQNGKPIIVGKIPNIQNSGTIVQAKESIQGTKEIVQNGSEKLIPISKILTNNSSKVIKMWSQTEKPENIIEAKPKSPALENSDSRPKIEISRVFVPNGNKSTAQIQTASQTQTVARLASENGKSLLNSRQSPKMNAGLRQDEMVVVASGIPESLDCGLELNGSSHNQNTKLVDNATAKSRDFFSGRKTRGKTADDGEKNEEISSHLNILTKALSTVEDKELRAKALKALADCGIGMERLVPICPASELRPVKESDTQTHVFGVVEPEHFIYVTQENSAVKRMRPIERKAPQKIGHIIGNPHPQELSLNNADLTNWFAPEGCNELAAIVEGFLDGNEGASEVRNIFTQPKPVSAKLVTQLEEDFRNCKKYDENGLLNIHRAVINDDLKTVERLLKVLKACEETADLPTDDGETCLELAVRYEVSPTIVKLLLDFGAEPTSSDPGHDSALIIASKKSLPILKDLVPYVTSRKTLDNYDSSGFAALHYCAQNDNRTGVIELARASADVNVRDRRSGRTPLFHAIENEHIELAQLLLDKGAQPNIASYSGHTVFALVEEGKHYGLAESLNRAGK